MDGERQVGVIDTHVIPKELGGTGGGVVVCTRSCGRSPDEKINNLVTWIVTRLQYSGVAYNERTSLLSLRIATRFDNPIHNHKHNLNHNHYNNSNNINNNEMNYSLMLIVFNLLTLERVKLFLQTIMLEERVILYTHPLPNGEVLAYVPFSMPFWILEH